MGLGNWLANARLSLHGYTPETIEAQRAFLQEQEAERQARAEHARRAEERQAAAEDRARQAAEDRATEAAEKRRAEGRKSVKTQIDLGTPRHSLMLPPDVSEDEVNLFYDQKYFQDSRAAQDAEAKASELAATKEATARANRAADEAEDIRRETRAEKRRRAQREEDDERERNKPKPDPDIITALKMVEPEEYIGADGSVDPAKRIGAAKRHLAAIKELRGGGAESMGKSVNPAADVALQKAVASLPPEDKAEFDAVLASGDPARIAEAKRLLLAAVGGP